MQPHRGSGADEELQVPRLAERLRAGQRATRLAGNGDLPGFFRTAYGPGWALAATPAITAIR